MGNNITEAVFILDASGSMADLTDDTIGGFNSVIREQRKKDGRVFVSVITFNQQSRYAFDRVDIADIPDMTGKDYRACGSTALIDAMGEAIEHVEMVHKYIRREDVPEHTIFFITTDGMENASRKYTSEQVKRMVEAKKELGWEFVFIAANIDAVETAAHYGISEDRAVNYKNTSAGNGAKFRAMGKFMSAVRADAAMDESWRDELDGEK